MWVFAWAALRLPLLALAVYVFRNPLVELYAGAVGLLGRMDFFVYTVSTFSSRALLAILAMAGIGFGVWAAGKLSLSPAMRYGAILAGSFIAIWLAFLFAFKTDQPALRAAGAILILAINAIPYEWRGGVVLLDIFAFALRQPAGFYIDRKDSCGPCGQKNLPGRLQLDRTQSKA
ncbi:MAG: hypothetical protein DPW15_12640 [Chloroflexi bacterium]|nr:hypothetical protein [Chloroflexota bacterium]